VNTKSTYRLNRFLGIMVWIILISGTVVLLVAAITKRNNESCVSLDININGVQNNFFIAKKDVISILEKTNGGKLEKKPLHSINLSLMEAALQESKWIKNAELFFDNNNILVVKITEREPIARIFTASGSSFYMDSSLTRLPLSDKFSPRLPVFTDFPTDAILLSKEDSNLIKDIKALSEFINDNPFWMAQIDQIDITPERTFDLIPKLGDQVIHFGTGENHLEKFNNLLCFYKQVLTKIGWTHYSSISVQFKGQVVAVRRGSNEIKMDSLRSVEIMKSIIADAQKRTNDTANIQLKQSDDDDNINTSKEIENAPDEDVKLNTNDVHDSRMHATENSAVEMKIPAKKSVLNSSSSSVKTPKSAAIKENTKKRVPKAVMPSKSDY
jgi:cell division protein FtsQ